MRHHGSDRELEAEFYFREGLSLEQQNEPDKAAKAYRRAIRLNPNLLDPRLNLGMLHVQRADYREGKKVFGQLLRIWAENSVALNYYGYTCLELGHFGEARSTFYHALQIDPKDHFAMYGLAKLFSAHEDYETALTWIEQAVMLDPKESRYFGVLGDVHKALGQEEQATEAYGTAIKLEPAIRSIVDINIPNAYQYYLN